MSEDGGAEGAAKLDEIALFGEDEDGADEQLDDFGHDDGWWRRTEM